VRDSSTSASRHSRSTRTSSPVSPSTIVASLEVELPRPRDQVATRELDEFVHLRSDIARMIRDQSMLKKS